MFLCLRWVLIGFLYLGVVACKKLDQAPTSKPFANANFLQLELDTAAYPHGPVSLKLNDQNGQPVVKEYAFKHFRERKVYGPHGLVYVATYNHDTLTSYIQIPQVYEQEMLPVGEVLFKEYCISCHSVYALVVGPALEPYLNTPWQAKNLNKVHQANPIGQQIHIDSVHLLYVQHYLKHL